MFKISFSGWNKFAVLRYDDQCVATYLAYPVCPGKSGFLKGDSNHLLGNAKYLSELDNLI